MPKRKKSAKSPAKPLDTISGQRGRGRPRKVRASEIRGRADNYHWILSQVWNRLGEPLLKADTEQKVIQAFEEQARPYEREFVPALASLILQVIREPKFPKRAEAQIGFLGDSLAGRGRVRPRTARDICARERAMERAKSRHHIIRREYYVECSCGYKGPARDNGCRRCGAQIPPSLEGLIGPRFF